MTNPSSPRVLVVVTDKTLAAPGERFTIAPLPAPVPKSVTGLARVLKVGKRRRALDRARKQLAAAIAKSRPAVVVFDDWSTLEAVDTVPGVKYLALAHVAYARDGSIKDWWRMRQYLAGIETTIVWHEQDRLALIANEIYNVRVIEDAATAWLEEIRQALR